MTDKHEAAAREIEAHAYDEYGVALEAEHCDRIAAILRRHLPQPAAEGFAAWWERNDHLHCLAEESVARRLFAAGQAARPGWVPVEERPTVVCLCGSTRFKNAFTDAQLRETLAGKIVLTIGCSLRDDTEIFGHMSDADLAEVKERLDELHFRKIEMADEVLILNVEGYIGYSTGRELAHARKLGKRIRSLEPLPAPPPEPGQEGGGDAD